MAKKKKRHIPEKLKIWINARKRYRLSDAHIQMARELGLNPKQFGSLNNSRQESWKAPLPDFIEEIYYKRFKKRKPDTVKSIERIIEEQQAKQEQKQKQKQAMLKRPMVGVGVLVLKENQVLLMKRQGVHGEGTWCPPGGHLEYGEKPEECAIREVKEETNVDVTDVTFKGITNDLFEEFETHYITIWFETKYAAGEARLNAPYEMSEIDWFTWEDLPQPLFLPFQNLLQDRCYI